MTTTAAVLLLIALLLLLAGIWMLQSGERTLLRMQMSEDWKTVITVQHEQRGTYQFKKSWLAGFFQRAGIELTPGKLAVILLVTLLLVGLSWRIGGLVAVGLAVSGIALIAIIYPQYRYNKRREAIVAQIPLFLDQAVRSIATGQNLDGALRIAAEEISGPLGEIMLRVHQMVELGADIGEALRSVAQMHNLHELHFIAMAVRISRVHGSSPRDMLESISKLVRHREASQRELKALTGETRLSAWVLGLMPSGMAFYMMLANPSYLGGMWNDESGRAILMMALGLQLIGGFLLWRMVKSV